MNTTFHKEPAGFAGTSYALGIAPRTVLVPMLNLSIAGEMLQLAAILASGRRPGVAPVPLDDRDLLPAGPQPRIIVLGVVEVAQGQPLTTGMDMARSYRALFDFLPIEVASGGVRVRVDRLVKVARDVPSAVRTAASEEHAGLVLAHWHGKPRDPKQHVYGHVLDELLKAPPCDILLARPEGWRDSGRVLLPVRGGPSAKGALDIALLLCEHAHMPLAVMHNVPASIGTATGPLGAVKPRKDADTPKPEAPETGPYIEFNEHLEAVSRLSPVQVERIGTVNNNTGGALLSEIRGDDLVIMGMGDPFPPKSKGKAAANLPLIVATGAPTPLLVLRSYGTLDLEKYKAKTAAKQGRSSWVDMPFEYWFVENTYHGDEFRDPEEFLKLKRAAGLTISVALLTSNDARTMRSTITGLKRVLLEMHPLADQIAVIDAGSGDDTLDIARSLGVDAYSAGEILPDEGSLHGRGESWWKSLAVLQGDIIVWLDPRATRFHPSTALSLAGPLLRAPNLQLVKAFGSTQGEAGKQGKKEEAAPEAFSMSDASWGGFVAPRRDGAWPFGKRLRVQALQPADLQALTAAQLASLPPRTIMQVLCPALAGVAEPFGRDFAARRKPVLQIPVLTGHNLEVGMLLSVASKWGSRAVAQVELRHAQPAPPPQPGMRNSLDTLQILARRLDDPDLCHVAEQLAERMQEAIARPVEDKEAQFEVRALSPVERQPMSSVLGG